MRLDELEPTTKFKLTGLPKLKGEVIRQSPSGTWIRWAADCQDEDGTRRTADVHVISGATEVTVLQPSSRLTRGAEPRGNT